MLVKFKLLSGTSIAIPASSLIKIRRTVYDYEPRSAVLIQYDDRQGFSRSPLAKLVKRFSKHVPIAALTMLNKQPVFVSAWRVLDISPPNRAIHNPKAKAIISYDTGQVQSVLETVRQVQKLLNKALS